MSSADSIIPPPPRLARLPDDSGIEFLRRGILVGERDNGRNVRLHMDFGGREFVILQDHRDRAFRPRWQRDHKQSRGQKNASHLVLLG
jgi:hypothetical protein